MNTGLSYVGGIVMLLANSFLKWVLLTNIIAWLMTLYITTLWLRNFAYRTEIGIGILVLSSLVALIIVSATKSIRAATANPVNALRNE